ncbi:TIGR04282 family arsenosugar biosynthesis glycosyltransferase [Nocardioides sp.]|uniref:TIGR04282 family arsenosugar biosynthesis glycosyltransferase n=1 Tax=Nocardioides sp. TaxID=35761 RepID=UPI003D0CD404
MTAPRGLVVAKAPVAGVSKTRLGSDIGMAAAADVAAAALLDTLAACTQAFGATNCHLALEGRLAEAVAGDTIARHVQHWTVFAQHQGDFGSRLAHAHLDAGPGPIVQIGMDTPQVDAGLLLEVSDTLAHHDAVLGPAEDGGWWVLALRNPSDAALLVGVPMSTPQTLRHTRDALESAGLDVGTTHTLRDVDTVADAVVVAEQVPGSRFARAWHQARATSPGSPS